MTEADLTGDPEVVPSSTKLVDGVFNGSSNELVEKSKDINISGLEDDQEDVPALANKPANGELK